jgi:hypothetical protein
MAEMMEATKGYLPSLRGVRRRAKRGGGRRSNLTTQIHSKISSVVRLLRPSLRSGLAMTHRGMRSGLAMTHRGMRSGLAMTLLLLLPIHAYAVTFEAVQDMARGGVLPQKNLGRLEVLQFDLRPLMLKQVFAGVKDLYADNVPIRRVVDGDVVRQALSGDFKLSFFEAYVSGIHLRVITDLHEKHLLKIKSINGDDNNRLFFLDNRHDLFNMVKSSAPFLIILIIMAVGNAPAFSRKFFAADYRFFNFLFIGAALRHLFFGVGRKCDLFHSATLSYGAGVVKNRVNLAGEDGKGKIIGMIWLK